MTNKQHARTVIGVSVIIVAITASGCGNGAKSSMPTTPAEQAKAVAGGPIPANVQAAMQSKYGNASHPIAQGAPSAVPPSSSTSK